MIGLLGKKIGMTQLFEEDGRQVPVTVIKVGPCYVTQIRTKDKDGYTAVQLGFDEVKEKNITKAMLGHFKKANVKTSRYVKEIRTESVDGLEIGSQLGAENFEAGEFVDVVGNSIGRGFQGVVKRHNFSGGEKAHGTKMGREPGSIGSKAGGVGCRKKVRKGKKLPGHMGNERITVQNLKVVKVDPENQVIVVRGAVPGYAGNYVMVKSALVAISQGSKKWKVHSSEKASAKEESKDKSAGSSEAKS